MKSLLITVPILPGKVDLWRRLVSASVGERRDAYRRAIREGGLTRLRVWHEHGPDGSDLAVVLYEGATPERFLERVATGSDDFSVWFRSGLVEIHGLDLSRPPPPDLIVDESV